MSIQEQVNKLCDDGLLVKVEQSWPGLPERRTIYVTPSLVTLLEGPWHEVIWEKRWYRARQQIDEFIDGTRLTLRSAPRKSSTCFMSLLEPESNEIWEIRCRDPKPGLRIFGSFIKRDTFVALTCAPHECLTSEEDWDRAIQQYKTEWEKHFNEPAFRGPYPNDYLTNAIIFD
jgi:hypothetical protein